MAAPLKIGGFCCRKKNPIANIIFRLFSTNSAAHEEIRTKKDSKDTHFGFETVAEDEKEERGTVQFSVLDHVHSDSTIHHGNINVFDIYWYIHTFIYISNGIIHIHIPVT